MRHFLTLFFAILVFAACSKAPATVTKSAAPSPAQTPAAEGQKSSIESVQQFLLASAASDFNDHGPKGPLHFRNVRVGHLTSDGKESYRMCGEFLRDADKAEWTPFATIKTSGYEQYVGPTTYCPDSLTWDTQGDLSASLQSQLDSLR